MKPETMTVKNKKIVKEPIAVKRPRTQKKYIWINLRSSRGTDVTVIRLLPSCYTMREYAQEWSDNYIANSPIEYCTVTYKSIKILPRSVVVKRLDKTNKTIAKATKARNILQQMLLVYNAKH